VSYHELEAEMEYYSEENVQTLLGMCFCYNIYWSYIHAWI